MLIKWSHCICCLIRVFRCACVILVMLLISYLESANSWASHSDGAFTSCRLPQNSVCLFRLWRGEVKGAETVTNDWHQPLQKALEGKLAPKLSQFKMFQGLQLWLEDTFCTCYFQVSRAYLAFKLRNVYWRPGILYHAIHTVRTVVSVSFQKYVHFKQIPSIQPLISRIGIW